MTKLNKVFFISVAVAVFMTLIIVLMPNSIERYYENPEIYDNGFNYYLWKFRPIDRDNVARITGWVFFFAHLIGNGVLLSKLKGDMANRKDGLSKYNYRLLYWNLGFVILHFIHTWVWYDGLAQDTPVWSSQGSVIIMLVLILIMENSRRGLFFGKKVPLPKESTRWVMKNHGMFIALAIVFTFWYHPMENTVAHLFGFFYMYLLFIQMSLARTKMHNNKYFKVVLEVAVLFHGTSVAISTQNAPFAMFLFGFAAIFFVTQIYGLGLKKRTILLSQIGFLLVLVVFYGILNTNGSFADINEVFRIPVIEYVLVFLFVYLIYLPIWLQNKFQFKPIVKKIFGITVYTVLILASGFIIYVNSPYTAEPEMYSKINPNASTIGELLELDSNLTEVSDGYVLVNGDYDTNVIIVPGGKVETEAYLYLAYGLAEMGYKVTVVNNPFNLAILDVNRAEQFIEDDKENIIIGHSLGGVVASMVAANNESRFEHLILLGSYNYAELTELDTYIITAEFDIQMPQEEYDEWTAKITNLTEYEIEGGNHAYFGYYGEQRGDGEAAPDMANQVQQDIVLFLIDEYLNQE